MTKERHPMTIVVMMSLSMNSSVVLNSNRVIILCFLLLYIESAVLCFVGVHRINTGNSV